MENMEKGSIKKHKTNLKEVRCESCNRLLGKLNGHAEIKCPKCGKLNVINEM